MTIAACYVSSEGVVFGADSTVTITGPNRSMRHYDHAQKIFEVGQQSSLGIAFWGMAGLPGVSHRTLVARFADLLPTIKLNSLADVANHWAIIFWQEYSSQLAVPRSRAIELANRSDLTEEEQKELNGLRQSYSLGFCLGGYLLSDRTPGAYEVLFDPLLTAVPSPKQLPVGVPIFWGQPNLIYRLLIGMDLSLIESILGSGHWTGTPEQLIELLRPYHLGTVQDLPIREAIDWVHTTLYATNRAFKFSNLPPFCGGPVEIGVITTDRSFRWVRHKRLDAALEANGNSDGLHA